MSNIDNEYIYIVCFNYFEGMERTDWMEGTDWISIGKDGLDELDGIVRE